MNRRTLFRNLAAGAALIHLPSGLKAAGAVAVAHGNHRKKQARFRSATCAYSFRKALGAGKMSYDDLVHMAVDLDIDGLDLTVYWFPENLTDDFLLPLRRLAYKNGVDIYSISIRTELTQSSAAGQEKEVANLKKWIDVANKLSATHIRVFGGRVPKGATEDQAAGWAAEVLKRGAEYAGKRGVILGLENHGGITARAERIIQIVKKVDSPWVGINLDTGNFRTDALKQIEMCLPYAVNSQFKTLITGSDGKKQPSDWDLIVGMFAKTGYKGYLAIEYEGKEPAETGFPRYMKKLQAVIRKYNAAAKA